MEYGYYPSGDYKKAGLVDMVCETYGDLFNLWAVTLVASDKTDTQKADVFMLSLAEKDGLAWKFFTAVTNILNRNGGGKFIAGDKVTIADCCMVSLIFNYIRNPVGPMSSMLQPLMRSKFPRIMQYSDDL